VAFAERERRMERRLRNEIQLTAPSVSACALPASPHGEALWQLRARSLKIHIRPGDRALGIGNAFN